MASHSAARYGAALELIAASDRVRILQECERATGKAFITAADSDAVIDASARWTLARGHAPAWAQRVARRRLRRATGWRRNSTAIPGAAEILASWGQQ